MKRGAFSAGLCCVLLALGALALPGCSGDASEQAQQLADRIIKEQTDTQALDALISAASGGRGEQGVVYKRKGEVMPVMRAAIRSEEYQRALVQALERFLSAEEIALMESAQDLQQLSDDLLVKLHSTVAEVRDVWVAQVQTISDKKGEAVKALLSGNIEDALRLSQEVYERVPDDPQNLYDMAQFALILQDERALGYAEQALALEPGNGKYLAMLGALQIAWGDAGEGQRNMDRARKLAGDDPEKHYKFAWLYSHIERWDDARRWAKSALRLAQAGSDTHQNASAMLAHLDREGL